MLSRLFAKLTNSAGVPAVTHEELQQAHQKGTCTVVTSARRTNTPVDTSPVPSIIKLIDAPGRSRLIRQPSSRTGENPPYGMIGGIEETSASFEARSAPRSYPTEAEVTYLLPISLLSAPREFSMNRRESRDHCRFWMRLTTPRSSRQDAEIAINDLRQLPHSQSCRPPQASYRVAI